MATTTISSSRSLTIPAAYIEDARLAIIDELRSDIDALGQEHVFAEDRANSLRILRRDQQLLDQLGDDVDTIVSAVEDRVSDPIVNMLDQMVRRVTGRLEEACVYAPVPLDDVLELTDRLRWAAHESIRLTPELDGKRTVA